MKKRDENNQTGNQHEIDIKIEDNILKGVYANNLVVTHTKEEFILDFINIFPPAGIVTSRVICSPSHLKRIANAMHENLKKYESRFGPVQEAEAPPAGTVIN